MRVSLLQHESFSSARSKPNAADHLENPWAVHTSTIAITWGEDVRQYSDLSASVIFDKMCLFFKLFVLILS